MAGRRAGDPPARSRRLRRLADARPGVAETRWPFTSGVGVPLRPRVTAPAARRLRQSNRRARAAPAPCRFNPLSRPLWRKLTALRESLRMLTHGHSVFQIKKAD